MKMIGYYINNIPNYIDMSKNLIKDRIREKQAWRESDALRLASGEVSTEQLRCENGVFALSHLKIEIDFSNAGRLR